MPAPLTGARLRERRLALGLKQAEVAQRAAISPAYLNLIEHNRRNVTPEVLARLAATLDLALDLFTDAAPAALVEDLRAAAAQLPAAGAEVERVEDFTARFPGWAALVAGLHGRASVLEGAVAALNDRLGHDPHLSAALHDLLSALSGVRATAAILAETEDLSADWTRRFHQNLFQDSERLARGAGALVGYLDRSETAPETVAPQDEFEGWLALQGWHLAALEPGGDAAPLEAEIAALASAAARALALTHVRTIRQEAAQMPLPAFAAALAALGPDPARLAARFGTTPLAAMRRIALMPGAGAGLVLCDASGTLLFRKPAAGFTLPRFGAACPLWPLFSALARPGLALSATVETASAGGGRHRVLAFCESDLPFGFAGPDLRIAAMLILPDDPGAAGAAIPVGSTCRICPRSGCPARREASILGEAG